MTQPNQERFRRPEFSFDLEMLQHIQDYLSALHDGTIPGQEQEPGQSGSVDIGDITASLRSYAWQEPRQTPEGVAYEETFDVDIAKGPSGELRLQWARNQSHSISFCRIINTGELLALDRLETTVKFAPASSSWHKPFGSSPNVIIPSANLSLAILFGDAQQAIREQLADESSDRSPVSFLATLSQAVSQAAQYALQLGIEPLNCEDEDDATEQLTYIELPLLTEHTLGTLDHLAAAKGLQRLPDWIKARQAAQQQHEE